MSTERLRAALAALSAPLPRRRAARIGAALAGAVLACSGAPAAADERAPGPDAEAIAAALAEDPVYVDPALAAALPEERAAALSDDIAESGEALYVIVAPVVPGDRWSGDAAGLVSAVHDRMGAAEGHYLTFTGDSAGTGVMGWDHPAESAAAEGAVDAHSAALAPSYESDFAIEPGDALERSVELALSGEAAAAYEDARGAWEDKELAERATESESPEPGGAGASGGSEGPSTASAAALVAAAVLLTAAAATAAAVVRRRRTRPASHALAGWPTAFETAESARLDALTERIDTELVEVGERLAAADPAAAPKAGPDALGWARAALQRGLDAHAAATAAHAAAVDGRGDLADAAGALVLLDLAEHEMSVADAAVRRRSTPSGRPRHCYANPLHGTKTSLTDWREFGGIRTRTVPLCPDCARAVRKGLPPRALSVRRGGTDVPYYAVPAEESAWAATGFGTLRDDLVERILRGDLSR